MSFVRFCGSADALSSWAFMFGYGTGCILHYKHNVSTLDSMRDLIFTMRIESKVTMSPTLAQLIFDLRNL